MNRLLTAMAATCVVVGADAAGAQTRIEAGETVSGALTARDSKMHTGAHFELWIYSGTRGERIAVTVRSIQFDAYLIVQPFPGGTRPILARNDDGAGGNDSYVEMVLPEDGDYVFTVTSAQRGETGAYRLSVESAGTAASRRVAAATIANRPAAAASRAAPARVLVHDRTQAALLSSGARGALGTAEGDWRYTGRAGETVTIDMRSSEFDPYLTLYSVDSRGANRVAQDDNGGGGLNSRIVYKLPADGEYVVRAERRQPGRSGSYTISFHSSARASLLGLRDPRSRSLAPNSAVTGDLDGEDPKMHDGTPYDMWSYVGRSGETVRITLRSDDFDAFLSIGTVENGVFTAMESADDGAGGTDSRIDLTLPFAGEYTIRVNSLSPRRATGDYVLRIDSLR